MNPAQYRRPPKGEVEATIQRCSLDLGVHVRTIRAVLNGEPLINCRRRAVHEWLLANGYGPPGLVVPTHLEAESAGPTKRGPGQPRHASTDLVAAMKKLAAAIGQAP